jgi:hypothetical protein
MCHALTNHYNLQSQLSNAIDAINNDNFSKIEILHQLSAMQENVTGASSILSSIIPAELYSERRLSDSTIAQEVLQIPELLELILKHTSFWDVFNIYKTCRGLRAIVEVSPKLQAQLFLRPASTAVHKWRKPVHPLSGSIPYFEVTTFANMEVVIVSFRQFTISRGLPKIGTLWKGMQICQPPLISMYIKIKCAYCQRTA